MGLEMEMVLEMEMGLSTLQFIPGNALSGGAKFGEGSVRQCRYFIGRNDSR